MRMNDNDFSAAPNLTLFGDSTPASTPKKRKTTRTPKYYIPDCRRVPLGDISNAKAVQGAIGELQLPRPCIRQLNKITAEGVLSMLHDDILPVVYTGDKYESLDDFEILGTAKLLLEVGVSVPVAVYPISDADEQIRFAAVRRAKRLMEHGGEVKVAADLLAHLTASGHLRITKKIDLANALGVSLSTLRNFDLEATLEAAGMKRRRGGKHVKNNNGK